MDCQVNDRGRGPSLDGGGGAARELPLRGGLPDGCDAAAESQCDCGALALAASAWRGPAARGRPALDLNDRGLPVLRSTHTSTLERLAQRPRPAAGTPACGNVSGRSGLALRTGGRPADPRVQSGLRPKAVRQGSGDRSGRRALLPVPFRPRALGAGEGSRSRGARKHRAGAEDRAGSAAGPTGPVLSRCLQISGLWRRQALILATRREILYRARSPCPGSARIPFKEPRRPASGAIAASRGQRAPIAARGPGAAPVANPGPAG